MAMIDWEDRRDPFRALPCARVARFSVKRDWREAVLAIVALALAAREWHSLWRTVMAWF